LRFLSYAMRYTSNEDIEILRKEFSDDDFEAALNGGTWDFRSSSWAKWNRRYGHIPIPPLPKRQIPGVDAATIADFFAAKS
jgi:hypothetical protein